jgi:hypothetical protein
VPFFFHTDLWRVGIARAQVAALFAPEFTATPPPVVWLESPRPFTFYADPFGIWRNGRLYVFVEAYDYRSKRGHIEVHEYDAALNKIGQRVALAEPFHLSYPYLWEESGEVYMLPEAHRSGRLTLYRAQSFPLGWEPVCDLLTLPAIDASLTHWQGRYWLFFALPDDPLGALHIAFADTLTGSWQLHPKNPVLRDPTRARMGGAPFMREGALYFPAQNGQKTYGGSLTLNKIDQLSPEDFASHAETTCTPPAWATPFTQGIHTISPALHWGHNEFIVSPTAATVRDTINSLCPQPQITLFDVKRISRSPARALINMDRRTRRWWR